MKKIAQPLKYFFLLFAMLISLSTKTNGKEITKITHSRNYVTTEDLNSWKAVGTKHKSYYLLRKGAYLESPTIDLANYTQLTIKVEAGTYNGSSNNSNYLQISWQSNNERTEITHLSPSSSKEDLIRISIDSNKEPISAGKIRIKAPYSTKSRGCRVYSFTLNGTDVKYIDRAIPPTIHPTSCDFTSTQRVTLNCKNNHCIYYSLDGTSPTSTSTPYQNAFVVDQTTTVKAVTYNSKKNKSTSVTQTYTLKEEPEVHFKHDTIITSAGKVIQKKQTLYYKGETRTTTWSSSNNTVASVKNGQLRATAKGTCTITANVVANKDYSKGSATYQLTVKEKPSIDNNNQTMIFEEHFEIYANQSTPYLTAPMRNWETPIKENRVYGVNQCIELGIAAEPGNICSKPLNRSGKAILTFKAAAWNYSKEKTVFTLLIHNSNGIAKKIFSLNKVAKEYDGTLRQALSSYKIELDGLIANKSYLQFMGTTKYNRFYLSDICVTVPNKHGKDCCTLHGFWEQEDLDTQLGTTNKEITSLDFTDVEFDSTTNELLLPANINPNCLIYTKKGHHFHQNEVHTTNEENSCEEMILSDKASFNCSETIQTNIGSYSRNFGKHPNGWYSLYLPFSLTQQQLKSAGFTKVEKLKELKAVEKNLVFETVTTTEANTPYIVTFDKSTGTPMDAHSITLNFDQQTINSNAIESAELKGTYTNLYNGELAGKYVLNAAGDAFQLCTDKVRLSAFRVYLDLGENKNAVTKAPRYKVIHTAATTSVTTCQETSLKIQVINHQLYITTSKPYPLLVYSLSGCIVHQEQLSAGTTKINLQQPGIYLIHHQKITVL